MSHIALTVEKGANVSHNDALSFLTHQPTILLFTLY